MTEGSRKRHREEKRRGMKKKITNERDEKEVMKCGINMKLEKIRKR